MKTRRPINAKNTSRILRSILPPQFKMVKDHQSNGYKFVNLLYGAEIDFVKEKIINAYNDSFIDTFDLSEEAILYEARLSGIPNADTLISNVGSIKITNETEFYDGDPTRVRILESIPIRDDISGAIGLNYFRTNERGSGYLLLTMNRAQGESYLNSIYPAYRINLDTTFNSSGNIRNYEGIYTGIGTQSFEEGATDEILVPLDSDTLRNKYPLTRQVLDESGIFHTIDHYEPYLGWVRDETGTVKALVSYSGSYYYNEDGDKIYFRTAFNNPNGYNNYNTAYLDLRRVPISGTLKVYDIDILDSSGNATEIPSAGKTLYRLQSDRMNNGSESGVFDPIYVGYENTVPIGQGFSSYMEGQTANVLKTTSWSYLHEGGGINEETLTYEDGSGAITDRIKLVNPHSRYLVEYKYKLHDYSRYITTLDSAGYVNTQGLDPVYSLDNISGNLFERDFEFTKSPEYLITDENNVIVGYENSKILTFDGLDVRPGKVLFQIQLNLPVQVESGPLSSFKSVNVDKLHIGYSDEYIPEVSTQRNYYLNCPFDKNVVLNTVTEKDTTGNSNFLIYQNTGTSKVYRINYNSHYGKKIIRDSGNSYFEVQGTSFLKEYVHIAFGCKMRYIREYELLEIHDNSTNNYLELIVRKNGLINVRINGYRFDGDSKVLFNNSNKEFIIRFRKDNVSSSVPYIELYYNTGSSLGFRRVRLFRAEDESTDTISSNFLRCFKNCSVDIDYLKVYNEVF